MTTISSSTTTTTAYTVTADTTGALVLQTGATPTTAVTVDASQNVTLANALPVASGGTGVTTSTGSGANVLGTSPTLTTPIIGSAGATFNGSTSGTTVFKAAAIAGTTTITMPAVTGTMSVLPTTPSMVRLNTANGYGSTNTVIRRFTTAVTNQGSDITYADSATLGATFTINTTGIYAVSYTECFSSVATFGLSLNSNQLTTAIYSITQSNILMEAQIFTGSAPSTLSWTGLLTANDVIRAHGTGTATGTNGGAAATFFTIVRVA